MIRLDAAGGDKGVCALGQRICSHILELAHLVPAKGKARVAVLALDPKGGAAVELLGEARQLLNVGGPIKEELYAGDITEGCGESDHDDDDGGVKASILRGDDGMNK